MARAGLRSSIPSGVLELSSNSEDNCHSSSVRFVYQTCPRFSGRRASLSEDIAQLLLVESHHRQVHSLPLVRGHFPFYFSTILLAKWPNMWREASGPQLVHHTLTRDHRFPSLPGRGPPSVDPVLGPPSGSPNGMMTSYPNGVSAGLIGLGPLSDAPGLGPPSVSPKGLMTEHPNGRHT